MCKYAKKENGLQDLMEIMLECMMIAERGVEQVGLMVADGLFGLDSVIGEKFPGVAFQRCTTHLKRNMLARVHPRSS